MTPYRWGDPTPAKVVQIRRARARRRADLVMAQAQAGKELRRAQNYPNAYVDDGYGAPQGMNLWPYGRLV